MLAYDGVEVMMLFIGELCSAARLTKRAVEYYIEQGLISPGLRDNGYRDFDQEDLQRAIKISTLRKLGLGTQDIKAVLADGTGSVLQKLTVQKALQVQREKAKQSLLEQVSLGKSWEELAPALLAMEQSKPVMEKLLDAFPGTYGRFICLHFARFLIDPVITEEQQAAYGEALAFLDNVESLTFPKEVQEFLLQNTQGFGTQSILQMQEQVRWAVENPEQFVCDNRDKIDSYLAFKQSEEYRNSPVCRIQSLLKDFHATSGYYEVFIPAMKRLSASYAAYCGQLEAANGRLLELFPEIETWNRVSRYTEHGHCPA